MSRLYNTEKTSASAVLDDSIVRLNWKSVRAAVFGNLISGKYTVDVK